MNYFLQFRKRYNVLSIVPTSPVEIRNVKKGKIPKNPFINQKNLRMMKKFSYLSPLSIRSLNSLATFHLPRLFTSASESPNPNFMRQYLITSCGFSPAQAATASKRVSHITSPSKPDSVRHFLKHHGFTDPQIRKLIANYPPILCCSRSKNMDSNLCSLRQMGLFSEHELCNVIASNPQALQLASVVPRFEFWRAFFHGDTKSLALAFTRNRNLIGKNLDTGITPKLALLKKYDISQTGIRTVIARRGGFISQSTESMEAFLKRVEEIGFPRGSPMFVLGMLSFYCVKKSTLERKMDLCKSLGWSDGDLLSAILKFPSIICLSEENIRAKMAFFLQKAGCTPGYIALHPSMIGCSLEKRLIPRHHAMQILKSNGLLGTKPDFYSIMICSDKKFVEKIVLPYKDKLPTLLEAYIAARAGNISLLIELYGEHRDRIFAAE